MMSLAKDKEIFNLLHNEFAQYPDDLLNTNIFPHIKINFVEQKSQTVICIKIDYPHLSQNNTLKDMFITFMIISSYGDLKTQNGESRTDLLSEAIVRVFNFNTDFNFLLELKSDIEDPFDNNHYYRKLVFSCKQYNSLENKNSLGVSK